MCRFFSAIVTRQGSILFTEEDSHETIVARKGLRDTGLFLRHWVRVEYVKGQLRVDETSVPSWFYASVVTTNIQALYERVAPAWVAYAAAVVSARATYVAAVASALAARDAAAGSAWAAYDAARASAQAAYDAARAPTQAAYAAAMAPARASYAAAMAPAGVAYAAAVASARDARDAAVASARAVYTSVLSPIEGYVGA